MIKRSWRGLAIAVLLAASTLGVTPARATPIPKLTGKCGVSDPLR